MNRAIAILALLLASLAAACGAADDASLLTTSAPGPALAACEPGSGCLGEPCDSECPGLTGQVEAMAGEVANGAACWGNRSESGGFEGTCSLMCHGDADCEGYCSALGGTLVREESLSVPTWFCVVGGAK